MYRKIAWYTVGIAVALLIGPVLLARLTPREVRELNGPMLAGKSYEQITFRNEQQDLDLAGMLFLPDTSAAIPFVVFIHGSGTSYRDNSWYLSFAHDLQAHGVAVLLPDKRGSELSAGDWRTSSFEDLATDTHAAIAYLKTTYADRIASIGVMGLSQGGQIAPIAATQSEDVDFVINVVGSAVPFHEALVFEENHNIRQMGVLPGFSNAIAHASSWYIRRVAQQEFWDTIGNYDPLPYWAKVQVPALILYGENDTNCPTDRSVERLAALSNSHIRVLVFPDSGHPLEDPPGGGNDLVRDDALLAIREFVIEASHSDS